MAPFLLKSSILLTVVIPGGSPHLGWCNADPGVKEYPILHLAPGISLRCSLGDDKIRFYSVDA